MKRACGGGGNHLPRVRRMSKFYRGIWLFFSDNDDRKVIVWGKRIVRYGMLYRQKWRGFWISWSDEVVEVGVTIVARFPGLIERIPCSVVINKGGNVEHLTHPFVCHIYIGICVINEGTHLGHDVIPLCLLFGGDERKDWGCHVVCFVFHVPNMAYFWAFFKGCCASTPTGFLPLDFSTLTCKDNRLPNHNGRNILRGSYHRADWIWCA